MMGCEQRTTISIGSGYSRPNSVQPGGRCKYGTAPCTAPHRAFHCYPAAWGQTIFISNSHIVHYRSLARHNTTLFFYQPRKLYLGFAQKPCKYCYI